MERKFADRHDGYGLFDSPDQVSVRKEDVEYLLKEARRAFPDTPFTKENIITTFAGLRPLVHDEGTPSKVSRKHVIEESYSGVIFVMGGKYTTYRKIAEDCMIYLRKNRIPLVLPDFCLYGSGAMNVSSQEIAQHCALDVETVEYLKNTYGTKYQQVMKLVEQETAVEESAVPCSLAIEAQVVYAIETEMARTVEDIFWRRLGLEYNDCPTRQCQRRFKEYWQSIPSTVF